MAQLKILVNLLHSEFHNLRIFSVLPPVPKNVEPSMTNRTRALELMLFYANEHDTHLAKNIMVHLSKQLNFTLITCNHNSKTIAGEVALLKKLYGDLHPEARAFYINDTMHLGLEKYFVPSELRPTLATIVSDPVHRLTYSTQMDATETLMCQFCGNIEICITPRMAISDSHAQYLIQLAKFNSEVYYSVVGLASQVEKTLLLFEAFMPRFFTGALYKYKSIKIMQNVAKLAKVNMTAFSHPVVFYDNDFYNFLIQKFNKQLSSL